MTTTIKFLLGAGAVVGVLMLLRKKKPTSEESAPEEGGGGGGMGGGGGLVPSQPIIVVGGAGINPLYGTTSTAPIKSGAGLTSTEGGINPNPTGLSAGLGVAPTSTTPTSTSSVTTTTTTPTSTGVIKPPPLTTVEDPKKVPTASGFNGRRSRMGFVGFTGGQNWN